MKRDFRPRRLLSWGLALLTALSLTACGGRVDAGGAPAVGDLVYTDTLPLAYADQFAVYHYKGGYTLIDIFGSERLLVVPEGKAEPKGLDADVIVIRQPLERIYLAATSAMALFDAMDALDAISFVGSRDWYTENAVRALEEGRVQYAGKYSAPDYEMLLDGGCSLAVESTMILHNPEVKEKLIELGIPAMVERSSYESHPLGRTEWIKVYGALLGKEAEAVALFNAEADKIRALDGLADTGKTVAFFYVSSGGSVVTYKANGYVPAMIRIAGGEYIFSTLGLEDDSKLSSVNMTMEEFYASAAQADIVIYNCSIASQLRSLEEFLALNPVLSDLKAVRDGNVWCTTQSMFQQTDKMGTIIEEMNAIFTGAPSERDMTYIFKLQ